MSSLFLDNAESHGVAHQTSGDELLPLPPCLPGDRLLIDGDGDAEALAICDLRRLADCKRAPQNHTMQEEDIEEWQTARLIYNAGTEHKPTCRINVTCRPFQPGKACVYLLTILCHVPCRYQDCADDESSRHIASMLDAA